jgi:hypothetical protein
VAKRTPVIEMTSYGIYSGWDAQAKELPKIKEFTQVITADEGVEFGFTVNVKKAKGPQRTEALIVNPHSVNMLMFVLMLLLSTTSLNTARASVHPPAEPHHSCSASSDTTRCVEKRAPQKVGVFHFDSQSVLLNSGYTMPIVGLGRRACPRNFIFINLTHVLKQIYR